MDLTTIAGTGQGLTASDWTTSVQNGTAVASLTMQHSVRSVTIAVSVDAQSQEIVVKLSGQATQAGVTGAPWGLAGLDLNAGRLIVPANTGIVFDREHPGWGLHADVSERLAGADARVRDACRQHWVLYSTDPQYLFKQLRIATRGSSTLVCPFRHRRTGRGPAPRRSRSWSGGSRRLPAIGEPPPGPTGTGSSPIARACLAPPTPGRRTFTRSRASITLGAPPTSTAVAVSGGCWICVVNPQPINVYGP
jgi:hypothetical protein